MTSPVTRVSCSSVLLVMDEDSSSVALRTLERFVEYSCARITVVSLPRRNRLVTAFAPMTGVTTVERLRHEAEQRALCAARDAAIELGIPGLTYRVARDWRAIAALVATGCHDVVILGRAPRTWREQRRLACAGGLSGSSFVVARGDARPELAAVAESVAVALGGA